MNTRLMFDNFITNKNAQILEIGPLTRPLAKKDMYPNTLYCDIRNTEQIKQLYSGNDYLTTTNISVSLQDIINIDVVIQNSYKDTFKEKHFDYVIASHVLEHVEDIIYFLQDIYSILNNNGGEFIIFFPDKRYCFDHFREEASFRDAYDVFINKRPALARMVLDFFSSAISENNPNIFWADENLSVLLPQNNIKQAVECFNKSLAGKSSDDVHYWPFSDSGFIKFLYDLTRADLIQYHCKNIYPTECNTQEFLVILQKTQEWEINKELDNLRQLYKLTTQQTQLSEIRAHMVALEQSLSWRITKPLRIFKKLLFK